MRPAAPSWIGGALTAAVIALTTAAAADKPAGAPSPPAAAAAPSGEVAGPPAPPAPGDSAQAASKEGGPAAPSPAAEAPSAAPAPAGTPLSLRPAAAPFASGGGGSGGIGLQVALVVIAIAAGYWLWKRRARAETIPGSPPKILSRVAIGVRSELLVVDVDGQKMLLGVTPGSVQRIAVLGPPEAATVAELSEPAEPAEPGFRALWRHEAAADGARGGPTSRPAGGDIAAARPHVEGTRHNAAPPLRAGGAAAGSEGALAALKARAAKVGTGADDPSERSTLPGLGMSDVEEQARGLRAARRRA